MKRSNIYKCILKFFIIGLFVIYSIPGGANAVVVQMGTTTGFISGRVTDTSGNGIANVDVGAVDVNNSWAPGTSTDNEGYYTLSVPEGTYRVIFSPMNAAGYFAPENYNNKPSHREADLIIVVAGQTTSNINAQLEAGGKISGRVTDSSGNGLQNAYVFPEDTNHGGMPGGHTDNQGYYSFPVLPGTYTIRFEPSATGYYLPEWYYNKDDRNEADSVTVTAGQTTSNINAQLEVGGRISGRITNTSGDGIAEVDVWPNDLNNISLEGAFTDSQGYYTFSVPAGTYKVAFYPRGAGYYALEYYNNKSNFNEADLVTVIAGQTTSNINAQLEIGGKISGKVTDASNNGIANVDVHVVGLNSNWLPGSTTDNEGYYTLSVAPGTYKVFFDPKSAGYFLPEYYNNKFNFDEADLVTVVVGQTTSNINAQLTPHYYTLTVTKEGAGKVTSSPAGINCGSDCTERYAKGIPVTLTATPDPGSKFTGWSGGGCSGTVTCVVVMNTDIALTAAFSTKAPDISVSPSSLDFGSVKSGKKITKILKITNNSLVNLMITLSGLEGTDFSIQGSSSVTIKAKKSYSLKILCMPTSGGLKTAKLEIHSNDPDTPTLEISLAATLPATTPDISVAQTTLDFGSIRVGKKVTKTLKITNNGSGDLVITLSGLEGTDFSIQGSSSVTIKAKKSYSLKVLCTPTSVGLKIAILKINSNDPDTPVLDISISGTGQ
jgi:hypothetical protein